MAASEKTLNAKNLATLGAERLAELLMDLATGDAAAKRRLRLELASRSGGSDAALEIRKRLGAIAKAKTYLDWRKIKSFAVDLEVQRAAIVAHVAPTQPGEAFELMWRLLAMAPTIYLRSNDSNGVIQVIMRQALADLGVLAEPAGWSPSLLADRVYEGVNGNEYGQYHGLIAMMAMPLGREGLDILKAKFAELAATLPSTSNPNERRINEYGSRKNDYAALERAKDVRNALTEIADAMGDVDGYAAYFSARMDARAAHRQGLGSRFRSLGGHGESRHLAPRVPRTPGSPATALCRRLLSAYPEGMGHRL